MVNPSHSADNTRAHPSPAQGWPEPFRALAAFRGPLGQGRAEAGGHQGSSVVLLNERSQGSGHAEAKASVEPDRDRGRHRVTEGVEGGGRVRFTVWSGVSPGSLRQGWIQVRGQARLPSELRIRGQNWSVV